MSRVRIKICGITSLKDLHIVAKAGVDAVGFVVDVPQSPRNLPIEKAKELIEATPVFVQTVAVTILEDLNHLEKMYQDLKPDIIQIHGLSLLQGRIRERLSDAQLIGAIQVKPDFTTDLIVKVADSFDAILLDSYVSNNLGGTGRIHDWELSKHVREVVCPKPLILAGGLKPENVVEAINLVKPYAVDVSSGVESCPGKKDEEKVLQFIRNVKEAEI